MDASGITKNVTLMETIKPSVAIRSFINGKLTVCECEGMVKAVIFNALCDLIGDSRHAGFRTRHDQARPTRACHQYGFKARYPTPPGDPAYNVSKTGLKAFTETLQHELRNTTGCNISAHLLIPDGRFRRTLRTAALGLGYTPHRRCAQ
jgi:hypothetical protein